MVTDLESKKKYLCEVARLCEELIRFTSHECLKRFLAFRIVLAGMAFEDLLHVRQFSRLRTIRNAFLAHGQDGTFMEGFNAANDIRASKVRVLMDFMHSQLHCPVRTTRTDRVARVATAILSKFEHDLYSGVRMSNNFLCACAGQLKDVSSGPLASVGYRFVSSRELAIFSNYFLSNVSNLSNEPPFLDMQRIFKSYYILCVVNMHDAIFRDMTNRHSIDGLREVMKAESLGNWSALDAFQASSANMGAYRAMRDIRNKTIGHLDSQRSLADILHELDVYDVEEAFSLENALFTAVTETAMSHIAIRARFLINTTPLPAGVTLVPNVGFQNEPYDDVQ